MLETLNQAFQVHGLIMGAGKIQVIYRSNFELSMWHFHM